MAIKHRLKKIESVTGESKPRMFYFNIFPNTDREELVETFCRENDIEIRPGDVFMFVRGYYKLDDSEKDLSPEEATHWEISRLWRKSEEISGSLQCIEGSTKYNREIDNPAISYFFPKQTYSFLKDNHGN